MKRDFFQKLWSNRNTPRKYTSPAERKQKSAARDTGTKQGRAQNAVIEAAEKRRRDWERYIAARKHRLSTLAQTYPNVSRYRATLKQLLRDPECKWTGPRDCNIDLAALCEELELGQIKETYGRFLLVEITKDFIIALGKRTHTDQSTLIDDIDPLPLGIVREETELDRVKCTLCV